MSLRMDKDETIYIDVPGDVIVIFKTLERKYIVESRKFGHLRTFDSQLEAAAWASKEYS